MQGGAEAAERSSSLAPPELPARLVAATTTHSHHDHILPDVKASSAAPCCAATYIDEICYNGVLLPGSGTDSVLTKVNAIDVGAGFIVLARMGLLISLILSEWRVTPLLQL
jgi:hypothetical protein